MTAALAPPKPDQPDDRLTVLQRAWVDAFVSDGKVGGDHIRAAEKAGYTKGDAARVAAHTLMRLPHVRESVRERIKWELEGPLAALAIKNLRMLSKKTKRSQGDRTLMATAFGILDRAGFMPTRPKDDGLGRDIATMSQAELQTLINEGEQRLSGMAKDVTPTDTAHEGRNEPAK